MLKRWSIDNFKSFRERTDIPLAPITIFAGANSSGKSTIIQSILLLKQTLQYAPINRAIALNGPLLKLGTFNDVKNASNPAKQIGMGFEIEVETRPAYRTTEPFNVWTYPYFGEQKLTTISGDFKWDVPTSNEKKGENRDSAHDLLQLQPQLLSLDLSTTLKDQKRKHSYLTLHRTLGSVPVYPGRELPFDVKRLDPESTAELSQTKPDSQIAGAAIRHFLPAQIGVRFDAAKQRARQIAALICGEDSLFNWGAREIASTPLPSETARKIEQRLFGDSAMQSAPELFPSDEATEVSIEKLIETFRSLRMRRRVRPETANASLDISEIRRDVESILLEDQSPKVALEPTITAALAEATNYIHQYLVASVRYLGPLRDEPKPIYPLEALANPTEVGYKGEHTAAVLDLHRDRRIQYVPTSFIGNNDFKRQTKTATLHDAVVDWMKYVGVASEVTTSDSGKFGHQLQVQTEGVSQFHDLTNVGVGVSQVLPIIVMALLADKPSFLIFEQPELHLHPKVQARLADFFLSVALSGKQCLLETHSEYLIERFRRRVAESRDDALTSILKIYFTERSGGATTCRHVEVTKYGAIADWPQDFFDQSQIETEMILQAASAKRLSEKRG